MFLELGGRREQGELEGSCTAGVVGLLQLPPSLPPSKAAGAFNLSFLKSI